MNNEIGIYIHIPFCISKCFYCDFTSYANRENMIEKYIYALCNEILAKAEADEIIAAGYEDIVEKLSEVGAKIRIKEI